MDVLNPSARQYTVAGLKPESVYVFRITAQTRKGWGEAAEALVVITEKRGERPIRGRGSQRVGVSVFSVRIQQQLRKTSLFRVQTNSDKQEVQQQH